MNIDSKVIDVISPILSPKDSPKTFDFLGNTFNAEEIKKAKKTDLSDEEEEAADVMGGTVYMKPTVENLKNMELGQSQSFMGGSLVDRAMNDMQRANQVRSEINAQGGQLKAGSMFKSLEMAQRIGGMFMMNPLSMPTTPGAIVGDGR